MLQQAEYSLARANQAYRAGHNAAAVAGCVTALQKSLYAAKYLPPTLSALASNTSLLARQRSSQSCRLWLGTSHNTSCRAYTLAEIYRKFADIKTVDNLSRAGVRQKLTDSSNLRRKN